MIDFNSQISRRNLLRGGLLMAAGLAVPVPAFCHFDKKTSAERAISLYNLHTGESLKRLVYWTEGEYQDESLDQLNWLLRDHRNDQVKPMDPRLFDLLGTLRKKLEDRSPVHIISGYRSPETNEMLRSQSSGVARHSLHMEGMALDIRLPGRNLRDLKKAAISLQAGGVGYYPQSDFVHVDTGRIRTW